jgi:hypothetical protein
MKLLYIAFVSSLLLVFSCKSEQDKFIQSELDKVKGYWTIDGFSLNNATLEQKDLFNSTGTILFNDCGYTSSSKKGFNEGYIKCSGQIQIGKLLYAHSYGYDYERKVFKNFDFGERNEMIANNLKYVSNERVVNVLLNGDWEIAVVGDKMTAKQVKNTAGTDIQISFNATRQP